MWEISNYNQVSTFLLSLGLGAIFCMFYDVIRALRKVCLNVIWTINICDMLIWIIYAFVTFIFLIARTNGEIRGYVLFGELFGFVIFRFSFSKLIVKFLGFVFIKIAGVNRKINIYFYSFTEKKEKQILKILKCALKIFKTIKKFLKNTLKLLYNNKNNEEAKRSLNETKTEA